MAFLGIEILSIDHTADPNELRDEVAISKTAFVILQATIGTRFVNPYLGDDAETARAGGRALLVTHYAEPDAASAIAEAEFHLNATRDLDAELGHALILESSGDLSDFEVGDWAQGFLTRIESAGRKAVVCLTAQRLTRYSGAPWGRALWLDEIEAGFGTDPYLIAAALVHGETRVAMPGFVELCHPRGVAFYGDRTPVPVKTAEPVEVAGESEVKRPDREDAEPVQASSPVEPTAAVAAEVEHANESEAHPVAE